MLENMAKLAIETYAMETYIDKILSFLRRNLSEGNRYGYTLNDELFFCSSLEEIPNNADIARDLSLEQGLLEFAAIAYPILVENPETVVTGIVLVKE